MLQNTHDNHQQGITLENYKIAILLFLQLKLNHISNILAKAEITCGNKSMSQYGMYIHTNLHFG